MVHEDVGGAGREAGDGGARLRVREDPVALEHPPVHRERGEHGERVVEDVERRDVPGLPLLQPFRQVLDDGDERGERRREEQRSREQEDACRVVRERSLAVAAAPRSDDDEQLRERSAGREDEEGEPAVRARS